jgi:hypothetical protein
VSRQIDAAWICGYPFVAYRNELALVAVPVWQSQPLYRSYLIGRVGLKAETLADLAGTVHAFSDPDSNSGYLVTCAALAEMGTVPADSSGSSSTRMTTATWCAPCRLAWQWVAASMVTSTTCCARRNPIWRRAPASSESRSCWGF